LFVEVAMRNLMEVSLSENNPCLFPKKWYQKLQF